MENAYMLFSLMKVLSLSCCLFWNQSHAKLTTISATVGSPIFLYCRNESLGSLNQLIWYKDTTKLITFASQEQRIHWYPEAYSLRINMSSSEATLYKLIIGKVQKAHAGNYMCETMTEVGVLEEDWTLVVTDKDKKDTEKSSLMLIIIISTICVGALFVVCLIIHLFRHLRQRNRPRGAAETVNTVYELRSSQKQQDIYENCLGGQLSQSHHIYSN